LPTTPASLKPRAEIWWNNNFSSMIGQHWTKQFFIPHISESCGKKPSREAYCSGLENKK
jgi:hypothetical protein